MSGGINVARVVSNANENHYELWWRDPVVNIRWCGAAFEDTIRLIALGV
jgi:hypothetical protein